MREDATAEEKKRKDQHTTKINQLQTQHQVDLEAARSDSQSWKIGFDKERWKLMELQRLTKSPVWVEAQLIRVKIDAAKETQKRMAGEPPDFGDAQKTVVGSHLRVTQDSQKGLKRRKRN